MGRLYIDPIDTLLFPSNDDNKKNQPNLSWVYKEESEMEKEIVRIIHSHKRNMLKPNSGESVTIRGHSICFTMEEGKDSDCREWEWHGFILGYDPEYRYSTEYTYGCYTEKLVTEELCDAVDANLEGMGLRMFGSKM